jgi:lipoprotein-anchoring transpeptidase ErfK/SrfK
MALKINGALALGVATVLVAVGGYAMLRAQPAARPIGAVEAAAAERAVTLAASAQPAAAPAFVPASAASAAPQATAETPPASDGEIAIQRILPITGPIKYGEWHWDEADVPAGPINITVDLEARVMSVWRGGYEIGAAAVLLGSPEKPTPTGTFPIIGKARHHISNIYNAPMPYMQRLTNTGISLHATTVERFYASHGCVGMPEEFAKKVFETTKMGDRVIITRGKMASHGDTLAAK